MEAVGVSAGGGEPELENKHPKRASGVVKVKVIPEVCESTKRLLRYTISGHFTLVAAKKVVHRF
jgi:hypothetical protein